MPGKNLLLVDDEEAFLTSLKQVLDLVSDVFKTDVSYSVNDAIKHIALKKYDMIVTDIRMPEKSGVELLIYLRDINYPGKVMVMSAFSTEESSDSIKSLGAIDVISKPFNIEWFKNMLLDWFVEEKERAVTFESVDLKTVLQIINLEKKTSVLQIETDEKKGMVYFVDGEIIHAEYDNLSGKKALLKLVSLENSIVSVLKGTKKVKPTIHIPFLQLIMEITGSGNTEQQGQSQSKLIDAKIVGGKIKMALQSLAEVKGYLGAGVVTPEVTHLEKFAEKKGIPIEEIASAIYYPMEEARKMSREVSFGEIEMMQVYTNKGIIIAACPSDEKYNFHALLVLQHDGNVAMAMMKLRKVVETLKSIL